MPGRLSKPATGAFNSAVIEVRVRWRSSCRVPLCSVRPNRMMLRRSQRASTSARMWLESSTVRPWALTSRMQSWKTASIKGSRPDVGSSRSRSSASEASAATRPTFWRFPLGVHARLLGRIELEALEKLVPPPPVEVAAEPTEEIDDLSAAEVRPQAHLAGYVRETAV